MRDVATPPTRAYYQRTYQQDARRFGCPEKHRLLLVFTGDEILGWK
jgi:hypothetical protein